MNLKIITLLSSLVLSLNSWGICSFVQDTKTDASQLKNQTVRTANGEYKINSVSRSFQMHSSGRFAVCNNIRLEMSSVDGEETKKQTFSTNLPHESMKADHLLAAMEDEGLYLTKALIVKSRNGAKSEIQPSFVPLMRSKQLSVCLQRSTFCSY